jgi:8-oxo-dGTP diphosphatase
MREESLVDTATLVNVRCSAIVFRGSTILLVRRDRGRQQDWVLPGGTPRPTESAASCARREVLEETGLHVSIDRVAFVLEATSPARDEHVLDLVFTAQDTDATEPHTQEAGLAPSFVSVDELSQLTLRPPIAGHLRALHARGGRGQGTYLGNVWRPGNADFDLVGGGTDAASAP